MFCLNSLYAIRVRIEINIESPAINLTIVGISISGYSFQLERSARKARNGNIEHVERMYVQPSGHEKTGNQGKEFRGQ